MVVNSDLTVFDYNKQKCSFHLRRILVTSVIVQIEISQKKSLMTKFCRIEGIQPRKKEFVSKLLEFAYIGKSNSDTNLGGILMPSKASSPHFPSF